MPDLLMNNCLLVDVRSGEGICGLLLMRVARAGGKVMSACDPGETIRIDFSSQPQRKELLSICKGAIRAVWLHDAELDWLVGEPITDRQLMWTITSNPIAGDHHAPAD